MRQRVSQPDETVLMEGRKFLPAFCAILLGIFLIMGVGFSHSDTVHDAAHDSRHSLAFPCH